MQRFVEHEDHVDVEENFNGIWAVVRCNAVLLSSVPRERAKIKLPVQKAPQMYYLRNKAKILERQEKSRKSLPERVRGNSIYAKYGMTQEDYEIIKNNQDGRCGICGCVPESKQRKSLVVDHNHRNKKVRGLLCNKCNIALGLFQDSIDVLKKSIEYLQKHS